MILSEFAEIININRSFEGDKWLLNLEKTSWLQYIAFLISTSNRMVESLKGGKAVLVHCYEGTDMTAQLVSLAQLILDKYYRTIIVFYIHILFIYRDLKYLLKKIFAYLDINLKID